MRRCFLSAICWSCFFLTPGPASGQEPGAAQAELQSRSLRDLVAALPGRPTTLEALVNVALDRSLGLEASALTRRIAESEVDIEGGIFDPTFRLGGQYITAREGMVPAARAATAEFGALTPWGSQLGLKVLGGENLDVFFDPTRGFEQTLRLSVSQPLLDGFNVTNAFYRSAGHEREAARHRYARAQEQLVAQIVILYWSLAEAEAVEAVRQRSVDLAEELLSRNQGLADRQLIATVDVLTARSGVALRRASLIDARRRRVDAAERIVFAAYGASATEEVQSDSLPIKTSTAPDPDPTDIDRPGAAAAALARRRDVVAAREALASATELQRKARSGLRPGLFLDGAWTTSTGSQPGGVPLGPLEDPEWKLGIRFTMPLGNRSDRGRASRAAWTVALRRVGVSAAENNVIQELRSAARAVRSGLEHSVAADEAAQLAAAQLAAERARLELGLGDSFRLLETEENAAQAELESVRSRYDLARASTRLLLARGEIRDRYR